MKKKVVKFSIRKYRKWCKESNEPVYPWALACKDKIVEDWNGFFGYCGFCKVYRDWVVIRYE